MRARSTSNVQKRAVYLAPLVFFLLSDLAAAGQTVSSSGLPNAWRSYAAQRLGFTETKISKPTVSSVRAAVSARLDAWEVFNESRLSESVSVQMRGAFDAPKASRSKLANEAMGGLRETLIAPAFVQRLGNGAELSINGVFAYQSFATPGLGSARFGLADSTRSYGGVLDYASGFGLGVDYAQPIGERLTARFGAQSRVSMEPFQQLRGAFGDPARFDLPSAMHAGIDVELNPRSALRFGVERINYSKVAPFSSADLPDRFLSLLGDRSSPAFEWRDLIVYSARYALQVNDESSLELSYSTQVQPEPTSGVLRSALASEYTDRNFGLAWNQRLSEHAGISLSAGYAPNSYFLGPSLFRASSERSGDQIEFEASYRIGF